MFTGIIEECGTMAGIHMGAHSARVDIGAHTVLGGTQVGDSIAVSGVCLTVTDLREEGFSADLMRVTLETTSARGWTAGTRVNLERALPAGGRMGGHIVQGHVDGVATIAARDSGAEWEDIAVQLPPHLSRYAAPKGSIALDGISLTLAAVEGDIATVSLIPATLAATTAGTWAAGDLVNVEVDVIAKYVERLLGGHR